jgi:MFS family permease
MSRDLILMAFSLSTWGVGEGMSIYFQSLYLKQLGAHPILIGFILGAAGIVMAISHIPAGYLADRIGRRPLIWISWLLGMAAVWIMALGRSMEVFVSGLLLYSMTGFVIAPLNSYITAARGKLSVGRVITLISAAYSLGSIIGPRLGGYVADQAGGLRQSFLLGACVLILSNMIILFIRPQPVDIPHPTEVHNSLLNNKNFLGYLGIVFLAMFGMYLAQPLSPNFLQEQRDYTFGQIGQLGSITALGIVILNLFLGHIEARLGFLLCQVCVGVFALLVPRSSSFFWCSLGYFMLGGHRVARSLAMAQVRNLVHRSNMGLAYGIVETVGASTIVLAPPLAGFLYHQQPSLMYSGSLGLILFSLTASTFLIPSGQK